jgi:uncharacterized protein
MKMMKTTLAIAIASLSINASVNVFAQPAPAATAAAPAPAAVVTPEQKAAVADMLDAINFKQMLSQMGAAMTQSMPQIAEQAAAPSLAKLPPEEQAKVRAETAKMLQSSIPKLLGIYNDPEIVKGMEDIMARAYLRRFSVDEIKSITAFYKSDAGKKMMATAPQVMQETMPEIMALMSPRMNTIVEGITKEVKEKAEAAAAAAKPAESKDAKPAAKAAEPAKKAAPAKK